MCGGDIAPRRSAKMPRLDGMPIPVHGLGEESEVAMVMSGQSSQHRERLENVLPAGPPRMGVEVCRSADSNLPGACRVPGVLHVQQALGGTTVQVTSQFEPLEAG